MDENTIICRCSDITLKEIRDLIKKGYTTLDEIKRVSRAGMGPCQGRTCGQLILKEISLYTGKSISELEVCTSRPPIKGIKLDQIALGGMEDD
ncbi:(2Fe-2S)-binding protein [Brassicibacter mesophilus]|uniref:(2Fe-2S)-binding protein n=1 Tax=Brassicibacter mesophilus TaxID=745119 RepID=UPI003D203BD7